MALFPQHFIDDLRQQVNIVSVIQDYVSLKQVGNNHKGLCPFHSEKTPSFTVHADKGFFHCFGCNAGGDVFKFLELHEKVGFQDAVRMLAQKFGVAIPEAEGTSDDARRDAGLRESLLKMHEVAAAFFKEQLAAPAGARARRQLAERGIDAQTIEQLGLGYAPAGPGLKARLTAQGFAEGLLLQSGLLLRRDNGDIVDRFRHRLMVPICRESGSVIAFGGRAMDGEQMPKYLNSPETPLYSKSRTLYGLSLTKSSIGKVGYAVLVEGYFDFAQVFQTQAAPAVASCGTALTPQQVQLLRRFTSKVVLSYDPDAAGQGAAAKSCKLLVEEGFVVNVAVMDKGEDPDTFIRQHGPDKYREKLRSSRSHFEYLSARAAVGKDFRNYEERGQWAVEMIAVAAWSRDATARDQFADRIAHKSGISGAVVRAEISKTAAGHRPALAAREPSSFGQFKDAEKGLIWSLIHNADGVISALVELDEEDLNELAAREVFQCARRLHDQGELSPSALLERLSTVNAQLVSRIASSPIPPAPALDCARKLKGMRWDRESADIQRKIDRLQELGAGQHGNEIDALWQRKIELRHLIEKLI